MNLLLKVLYYFCLSFSIIFSAIYIWHKLLNQKINFNDKKLYFSLFSLMAIALLNYFNVAAYLRISGITIILIFFFKFLFKTDFRISIITPVFSQIIVMLSEMIFVVLVCIILDVGSDVIVSTQFGSLFSNIGIALISMIIIHIPFVKTIYKVLVLITNKISKMQLTTISLLLIMLAYILSVSLYFKIEFRYLLILNTTVALFCFSIVMYMFKTKNNYIKINEKYNNTLNSLKEYEEILDRYRISNHENKNELLTIRNMLPKNNKKIISYIDTIVENKLKDNDKIMLEISKIPSGGLRGLMYSKVLLMEELNINYQLHISKEVRTFDLIKNIEDSTMLDICKTIGVYVDNSIQSVELLKTKNINIDMYFENKNLVISISNNYKGKINESKLDSFGYTTKGTNHGYGLALVKDIINKNDKLENERKISKDIFTQILKIKM